jgi:hypothetical protein
MHYTRAPEKSIMLMVETAAIVPTGDAGVGRRDKRLRAARSRGWRRAIVTPGHLQLSQFYLAAPDPD